MRKLQVTHRRGRRCVAVGVAAAALLGATLVDGGNEAVAEGGRLSHLCRAGLWVMGTGHVATGGLLMWLGC